MDESLELKLKEIFTNGPVPESLFEEVEGHFGCALPDQYKRFMVEHDGGEGLVGEQYLILWRVGELADFNRDYEVAEYAPGLLMFGSNGGGEAFAFDTREARMAIVMVPVIGMSLVDATPVAETFEGFLASLADGTFA